MSAQERLEHWREERKAIEDTIASPLHFKSFSQPVLEADLKRVDRFIAYYEARVRELETGQGDGAAAT
jgi:hypothetical protein